MPEARTDKPRSLILTVALSGLLLLVPPLLLQYGPDSVRRSLQALQRGVLWEMGNPGEVQFETLHRQLGVLSRGESNVEFAFENRGEKPVRFTRTWSSCGCVRVSLPAKSIPAGGSGTVVLHLNTVDAIEGSMWELAKIFTDEMPESPYLLMIEAEIQ